MTTADRTPLAEQIAREHKDLRYGCKCGVELDDTHAAHIATVTEQAVRERVAADIEARVIRPCHDDCSLDEGDQRWNIAVDHAARIARGAPDA